MRFSVRVVLLILNVSVRGRLFHPPHPFCEQASSSVGLLLLTFLWSQYLRLLFPAGGKNSGRVELRLFVLKVRPPLV